MNPTTEEVERCPHGIPQPAYPRCAYCERNDAIALLRELIDIEGPQPGNAAWGAKVQAFLAGVRQ